MTGAVRPAEEGLTTLVRRLITDFEGRARVVVAIAGPPGSGKSTMADRLRDALLSAGETAAVLPMDGFHMDNGVLEEKGLLPRKGAPQTFDVRAFGDIVRAVRAAEDEVLVPVFDRSREIAIASARIVSPDDRFILIEGNYLLLDEAPWATLHPLYDVTILIAPPVAVLEERLMQRWYGYGYTEEAARAKLESNDMPNGRLVLARSITPDLTLESF